MSAFPVRIRPGNRGPGPPVHIIKVFGLEAGDDRIGRSGVHHREEASGISDIQAPADREVDQIAVPVGVCMLAPESTDIRLLRRAEQTIGASIVARLDEVLGVGVGCSAGLGPSGLKLVRIVEGKREDLADLGGGPAAVEQPPLGSNSPAGGGLGAALIEHHVLKPVVGAQRVSMAVAAASPTSTPSLFALTVGDTRQE